MEELDVQAEAHLGSSSAGASNKLFLGGLSWITTEETIRQHFQEYGDITEVIVMRDRITNKPRGFGFITFKDQSSADNAFKDTHVLDGRTIDAKPSLPHGEHSSPKSKKIFVGGLAPETNEDAFKQHFERFGKVLEAQIMVDHTSGRSRGFGFITFEDESAVVSVFSAGSMQELGGKKVEVKTATPKGSGPIGRGTAGMMSAAVGREMGLGGARSFMPGRFGDFAYGIGPAGYPMPAGYMPVPGYGGYVPYGAFPGMMLGGYTSYPYGSAPYGFAGPLTGFAGGTLQQQRAAGISIVQQRRHQQLQQAQQQPKSAVQSSSSHGRQQQQQQQQQMSQHHHHHHQQQQQQQMSQQQQQGQLLQHPDSCQEAHQQVRLQQQESRSKPTTTMQQLGLVQLPSQSGHLPSAADIS